jgi:hypothetical protein
MSDPGQCRHCGRPLPPSAQFCDGCGIPVPASDQLTSGTTGADIPTMAISSTELVPPGPNDPYDPYEWEPRRRILPWIAGAVAVALVAVAIFVAASSSDKHASVTSAAHREGPIAMPWVLTFKLPEARALLRREGVTPEQISVVREQRKDVAPGTVVGQTPRSGMNVVEGVTLTVARLPDKTPNFVGKGINASSATLATLGVKLTIDDALNATVSDGKVLDQTPAAGAPFAKAIRLTVARRPIPTNLGDLNGVGTAPAETTTATIAGTVSRNSAVWQVPVCPGAPPVSVSYLLAGHYNKFAAIAGLRSDNQDPADRVRLDIAVDGVAVFSRDLDMLSTVPIDIDLTDHQQLALTFTPLAGGDPTCRDAPATLGQGRVVATAQSR